MPHLAIPAAPVRVRLSLLLGVGLHPHLAVQVSQAGEVVGGHDVYASPNHHPYLHL